MSDDVWRLRMFFGVRMERSACLDSGAVRSLKKKINSAGFRTPKVTDFNSWELSNESAVVLDLRENLSNQFFAKAKAVGKPLCSIDDPTPNRLQCDLVFYPPVPQVEEMDWAGFKGRMYCGWEFIPLRKEFYLPAEFKENHSEPGILITMGGSDPHDLTLKVLSALKDVNHPWQAEVVIGPMFNNLDKIERMAVEHGNKVKLLRDIKDMAELMRRCDAAVASFGMTAYELAACGVPQILLCLTEDHARSASALHESKAAISMGKYDRVNSQDLVEALQNLITDRALRMEMGKHAASLQVGRGASNIASVIMQHVEQNRER